MSIADLFRRFASRDHRPDVRPITEGEGVIGEVLEALHPVVDPELGLSIVELGLLREIAVEGGRARVVMTLTTAGCPMVEVIRGQVEQALRGLGLEPEVVLSFEPPWKPSDMTEAARAKL